MEENTLDLSKKIEEDKLQEESTTVCIKKDVLKRLFKYREFGQSWNKFFKDRVLPLLER